MTDNIRREKEPAVKSSESSNLPPSRSTNMLRPVSPPLVHTPLRRLIYYVAIFATIIMAFYSWRMFQWKTEYGGWWNLALGKRPPGATAIASTSATSARYTGKGSGGGTLVEDKIQALADALGMPSSDLASAIADAVREHVPPASLSSVAAHESSGTAVQYLVNPTGAPSGNQAGTMKSAFEAVVGLDEPSNEFGGE
ncbi:hypothetical protein LXA43DRAFT_1075890 [Ganoderma leucocontextum]|nr:hypothetical protein LXA43DRAFT_1075890 [Ganoderma leucocontextum]